MFRKMRRFKQEVSHEECVRVLREGKRAALAVQGDDGYPYVLPINYVYDEADNRIYFHGAKAGHKFDAMTKNDKVGFTVWDEGFKKDGRWEWNVTSVVIFGRVRLLTAENDEAVIRARVHDLAARYYPTEDDVQAELNSPDMKRMQFFAIDIEHLTGKLVNER